MAFFGDYGLVAYDHEGRELWRTPLGPFDNVYGMGASPILAGGLVVLACDQSTAPSSPRSTPETGRERWRTARARGALGPLDAGPARAAGGGPAGRAAGLLPARRVRPRLGRRRLVRGRPAVRDEVGRRARRQPRLRRRLRQPAQRAGPAPEAARATPSGSRAQDADKDGRVTKAEADATSREYFDFIDLDKDGVVSESEWRTNQAMMAAENGLLAFRGRPLGRRHAQRPLVDVPPLGAAAADAAASTAASST